jgi:hypothetical protein
MMMIIIIINQTTSYYIPEGNHLPIHHRENLKPNQSFKRPSLNIWRSPYGPTLNNAFSFEAYAFG